MRNEEGEQMISLIMWIGLFVGIFMLYLTYLWFKRNEIPFSSYFLWLVIWISLSIVSVFPGLLEFVSKDVFHITRTLDFVYTCVGMFTLVMMFFMYSSIQKTNNKVEALVSKLAMDNAYIPKGGKNVE